MQAEAQGREIGHSRPVPDPFLDAALPPTRCSASPSCGAFTYNQRTLKCFLKEECLKMHVDNKKRDTTGLKRLPDTEREGKHESPPRAREFHPETANSCLQSMPMAIRGMSSCQPAAKIEEP